MPCAKLGPLFFGSFDNFGSVLDPFGCFLGIHTRHYLLSIAAFRSFSACFSAFKHFGEKTKFIHSILLFIFTQAFPFLWAYFDPTGSQSC